MRVLYDHQILTLQNYGGISRYFCELMDQFSKDPGVEQILALRYSYNENLCNHHFLHKYWSNKSEFLCATQIFPTIQKVMHVNVLNCLRINQRESVRLLRSQEFDLFHPTYYDPYFLQHLQQKPFVLTVHDMIHELYPNYFSPDDPTKIQKKKLIERADAIIAISESTKRDIIKFTNVDPDQISVVYHGNPLEYLDQTTPNKSNFDRLALESYILFVGNRSGYKNFIFFIKSVAKLLKENENLHIYCAGGGPFTQPELKIFDELNITSKIQFIRTNDLIMKNLYENAYVFVFPSLYEGFGLPILEAFSCGCPALLSDSSSLSEVGADAACYFDPTNPESLTQSIETVISDNHYRERLIKKGFERLKLFSWEKAAQDTKSVYQGLLNQ